MERSLPTRVLLVILAAQLAACGTTTFSSAFNARARVNTLPTDIEPTLVVSVDYMTYSGTARPGPLRGQAVTVTSTTGLTLVCTFSSGDWAVAGPGPCRNAAGRQYDMVLDRWDTTRDR